MSKKVRLEGARGEVLGFQVIVERTASTERLTGLHLILSDLEGPARIESRSAAEMFRTYYLKGGLPGVLVPLSRAREWDNFTLPDPQRLGFENNSQAIWVDLHVPREAPAGDYRGCLTVAADQFTEPERLEVDLRVWNITLPEEQNYDVELNEYGTLFNNYAWSEGYQPWNRDFDWKAFSGKITPAQKEEYLTFERNAYRLCHQNRVSLNALPYFTSGAPSTIVPASVLPVLEGQGAALRVTDWSEFDRRWGPLYDGSAFSDLWRAGVPLAHHYLPICHNLPSNFGNFITDQTAPPYWGKNPVYEAENIAFDREFERHANAAGWNRTLFQVYYNEKANRSKNDIIWNLDEPIDTVVGKEYPDTWLEYTWRGRTKKILRGLCDYEALRYFSALMHTGFRNTPRPADKLGDPEFQARFADPAAAKFLFRIDLGSQNRPALRQGVLDGYVDLWNVGMYTELDLCRKRVERGDVYTSYRHWDATPGQNSAYYEITAWTNYANGATGHTLWLCDDRWADIRQDWSSGIGPNTLIYPGSTVGLGEPCAGYRIKALRRGAQDWEYLRLLGRAAPGREMEFLRTVTSGEDLSPEQEFDRNGLEPAKLYLARRRLAQAVLSAAGAK